MADRGGYRRSKESTSVSGIGKNSKRTDGRQAIRSPNIQDSTDLQQGDRERIRQGQKVQPLSETPSPSVSAAPPRGPSASAGAGAVELPPHLMGPTSRPLEDEMTPASPPPVEPQDDKEVVLQFLIDAFGDENASSMLEEIRMSKQTPSTPMMPTTLAPEVVEEPGEPEAIELGEEPIEEEVVEEPVEEAPVV